MTCVIAVTQSDGTVVMGADHAFTSVGGDVMLGGYGHKIRIAKNFVVGYCGNAYTGTVILNHLEHKDLLTLDDEFSVIEINDLLNEAYEQNNLSKVGNVNHYLIVYNNKIFHVWPEIFCQMANDDVDTIGSDPSLFKALYKINMSKTQCVETSVRQTIQDASIVCKSVKSFSAGPTLIKF